MASAASTPLSLSSSSTVIDSKASRQPAAAAASSRCVSLPTLPPPVQLQSRSARTTAYSRKFARNVVVMSTGEVQAPVAEVPPPTTTSTADTSDEQPEIVKTIQEAWDKVDDKYAVTSVVVALTVGLWAATGMISAIEKLPLIPGVLELVGIGYSAWFAYKNLIFQPEREALIEKVKNTYKEIIGIS